MKFVVKFALVVVAFLVLVGCSNTRKFQDASWTQKPAKMKVLFTKPIVPETQEKSEIEKLFAFWCSSDTDKSALPESMSSISAWFKKKVDNTIKFNSNVSYDVDEVLEKQLSHAAENMDGVDVQVPKVDAMSDSFDVYLIFDDIHMDLKNVNGRTRVGGIPGTNNPSVFNGDVTQNTNLGAYNYTFKKGEKTFMTSNYVVYDVKTGTRLAYGHLDEELYHKEVAAEQGWYDTVRQMVLHAIEKTPITNF